MTPRPSSDPKSAPLVSVHGGHSGEFCQHAVDTLEDAFDVISRQGPVAIATLAGVQFWVLLGDVYTITQAKRLYRAIGTGSLAGAALGAGLARLATSWLPAEELIALGAALIVAGGVYATRRHRARERR